MLRRESRPGSMFWRAVGRGASWPDQVAAGKNDPTAGYGRAHPAIPRTCFHDRRQTPNRAPRTPTPLSDYLLRPIAG